MSYDIFLTTPKNRDEDSEVGNMTSNIRPMYDKAFGVNDWKDVVDGRRAGSVVQEIFLAYDEMKSNPKEYKKLNPENGWGDYEGALEYLYKLLRESCQWPECTIYIHR